MAGSQQTDKITPVVTDASYFYLSSSV